MGTKKKDTLSEILKYGDTRGMGVIDFPPPPLTDYTVKVNVKKEFAPVRFNDPDGHEQAYLRVLSHTQWGEQKDHVSIFHEPTYRVANPREGGVFLGGTEFEEAQTKVDRALNRVPLRQHSLDMIPKAGEINRDAVLPPILPSPNIIPALNTNHPMLLN
jgi:hypothetical protein